MVKNILYKALVVAFVATLATPAVAARWDIIPRIASEGTYDSNAALIQSEEGRRDHRYPGQGV